MYQAHRKVEVGINNCASLVLTIEESWQREHCRLEVRLWLQGLRPSEAYLRPLWQHHQAEEEMWLELPRLQVEHHLGQASEAPTNGTLKTQAWILGEHLTQGATGAASSSS